MRRILLLALMLGNLLPVAYAQFSPERQALNRMEKGKWKSAEESLRKALRKDSVNTEAEFIFSWFYTSKGNPSFNMDSAYHYSLLALRDFGRSSQKEKDKLKRFPIDSAIVLRQRKKIDSAAFERAKHIHTEKGYIDFLSAFAFASQRSAAIELRDEVAFGEALKTNTYVSFQDYLRRYPVSARAEEARQRSEKILYLDKTRDGKLSSYEAFYAAYPHSPYRAEVEKSIFEIRTASGRISALTDFLKRYPESRYQSKVNALIYHLRKEEENEPVPFSDSLKQIQLLDRGYWVPIYKGGKFGFINQEGNEVISPQFDTIRHEYICGNIRTDYLIVSGGIINRAGSWIVKDHITNVQDLGAGFLKITTDRCKYGVHKSGFGFPDPCHDNIKLLARNFLATQDHGQWGISTLTGKMLIPPQWDDVTALDTLILLVKNGKKTMVTLDQVARIANKIPLESSLVFDDVRWLSKGNYCVKTGPLEGVMNEKLEYVVPLDRQTITRSAPGFILERNKKFRLASFSPAIDHQAYDNVMFYGKWIRLQTGTDLLLYNIEKKKIENSSLDSVAFEQELALAFRHDSLRVYLKSGKSIDFLPDTHVTFMKSTDSSRYFFIPEKNKKTVIHAATGERMFSVEADDLEYIGHAVFMAGKGNKKGLLSKDGKTLLPQEYQAIVPSGKGWVSLLKDKKFGLYNTVTRKLIKPIYDRNVNPFSRTLLTAYKEGGYGFIDVDAKPIGNFEFEEIRPWNDTAAMVKKNYEWMIYAIAARKIVIDHIKDYHFVQDSPSEKVAVVRRDVYYGVISNKRGELIPANFSDIINVGSPEKPMYFSEKNVEEAGIHVVIYYDAVGKLLRKQAYEEDEYEKIYCEEN